jgi:spore germination cell wall hydrolase CwlJ-like protein
MRVSRAVLSLVVLIIGLFVMKEYFALKDEVQDLKKKLDVPVPVNTYQQIKHTKLDAFCMAKNIYHEARGESYEGKLAVAQVTINRLKSGRWGKNICSVVMSPYQFSWANDQSIRWSHPRGAKWQEAQAITKQVLVDGVRLVGMDKVKYFHADYVAPRWRHHKRRVVQIDRHIFYKEVPKWQ